MYICSNCGYGSGSWMGKCPSCDEWNSLQAAETENKKSKKRSTQEFKLTSLSKISSIQKARKKTGIFEFDRVLGGGLVPGSAILLTGEPGVGKSTLLLQALKNLKTVYISGEESAEQVADRAHRLKINLDNLLYSSSLQVEAIIEGIANQDAEFDVIVIDSIQTLHSVNIDSRAGGTTQLKEVVSQLIGFAKNASLALILIGHVTKVGQVAGPKTIEHLVDCVLTFEGEPVSHHRILRASKNRFGGVDEIGIFEMNSKGLSEVNDPMAFLEDATDEASAGRVTVGVIEGHRPLFFEIQSLASSSTLSYPRRVVKGVDYNKVLLLLAVIQKQLNIPVDRFDIYVNVVGGVTVKSTAADLGIIASIISSVKNLVIPKKTVFIGEVGLLGEVRSALPEEKIIQEARRLKFQNVFSSGRVKTIKDLQKSLSFR